MKVVTIESPKLFKCILRIFFKIPKEEPVA